MILSIKDLHVYYGNIHALKGISLDVNEGEIVTLIGANGAGKTTTMGAVSGLLPIKSGTIEFEGKEIQNHHQKALWEEVPCWTEGLIQVLPTSSK